MDGTGHRGAGAWASEDVTSDVEDKPQPSRPARSAGPSNGKPPFNYKTERTLRLRDIEAELRRVTSVPLRPQHRDLELRAIRATTTGGTTVRIAPIAIADGLFLDFRDLHAISAGGIVPGLDDALRELNNS